MPDEADIKWYEAWKWFHEIVKMVEKQSYPTFYWIWYLGVLFKAYLSLLPDEIYNQAEFQYRQNK